MKGRKLSENLLSRIIPIAGSSLALGSLFQWILPVGNFLSGLLAASLLIFLIGIVLYFTWHAAGRGKALAWMMFLAFILRFSYGVFLAWGLPRFGYEEPPQQSGFVFADAYQREKHAWALAQSDQPLILAFSDTYEADQYGGILAMSAFIYRTISPDSFRPALISILAAGAMALCLPFLMIAVRRRFNEPTAFWAGWIMALYPEGILLGSSQMREPFLILFFTMVFWAVTQWLERNRLKLAVPVFFLSLVSLLLFSFRVALPIIGVVLLWLWVVVSPSLKKSWLRIAGWVVIVLGLIAAFWLMRDWVEAVIHWDTLQTVSRSGRVQFQLGSLPEWLHFPFVLIYGLFQPVLPAAVAAPAPWIWRSLGILRSLGWYALMPLLVYVLARVWGVRSSQKKRWLIVMMLIVWTWVIISSARAGGDQWDNPRYRTIFLPWMAVVAGWGIQFAVKMKDRWLTRGLLVEGIFLAFFTEWYISRYFPGIPRLDFWLMIVVIIVLSLSVVVGGWLRDRKLSRNALTDNRDSL